MFGLKDLGIILAYLAVIGSVITCVVYGIIHWNKGSLDAIEEKEIADWGREEEEIDKEFE